ncbi:MAG: glycosyltransferase [Pyrinomonadaceae bacterium]
MRVVLCKGQFMGPISGADETIVTYATQLQAAHHSPSVLLMYPYACTDPFYERLKSAGVSVDTIASTGISASLGAGRKLASRLFQALPPTQRLFTRNAQKISSTIASRYFQECCAYFAHCEAELIHVMTPDPSAMVMIKAAYESKIPVLYQELGTPYHPPAYAAYYKQFASVLALCSEVAALSPRHFRQCYEELPRTTPMSVLPIMAEDLHDDHKPRPKAFDAVTFGFAARLEHLKGTSVLIEAFAALCRTTANCFLQIAGVGSQRQQLASRIASAGIADRCRLVGAYTKVIEKAAFMRSLDVFVLPSLTEGTPNSIVEAMACGLPVIASAVGGIADMVTAETGILVPPGEPAALASAMSQLAADPELRLRMGRAARLRYERFFSPEAVLPLMLNTYQRIALTKGHPTAAIPPPNFIVGSHPWETVAQK